MATNNSAINNIYNYYLTTYAPKGTTKFDTHKKSELRGVYNSIVKMNKDDPLFIVDKSQETKEYAIGLKEGAREFKNTIASLGGLTEDTLLSQKAAFSSNESLASVKYIGDNNGEVPSFDLEVNKLATTQINVGKMLPNEGKGLSNGTYSFDIAINGLNYEFQYNVRSDDTNRNLQDRLSRLINNADIGLTSTVVDGGNRESTLLIESSNTGASMDGGLIFEISDNNTSKTSGSVNYFGLNNVSVENSDAIFKINGEERHAKGNTFTVEKMYEIDLHDISSTEEDVAHISLQADVESMAENISKLVDGYNSFIDDTGKYTQAHPKSQRLVRELSGIASVHQQDLTRIGLSVSDDGHIDLDSTKFKESVAQGTVHESFKALQSFAGALIRKTNDVSLNPMNYADRTVVAYKNPGHNFAAPYVASPYTGMIFNSYC